MRHRGHSAEYRRSLPPARALPVPRHTSALVYRTDDGWYAEYSDGSRQGPFLAKAFTVGIAKLYTRNVQVRP